jgi:hypothetical protein
VPDKPLLVLGDPFVSKRVGQPKFQPGPKVPVHGRQVQRFGQHFQRLQNILERPNPELELRTDPANIAPDRALVFEVAGSLTDFSAQAERLGFAFLGDFDSSFDPDEDFYFPSKEDRQKEIPATLYLAMPDLRAMKEMLSLWSKYLNDEKFPRGTGQWKELFKRLKAIRPWGFEDRLTDSFLQNMSAWTQSATDQPFRFEIDLWFNARSSSTNNHEVVVAELNRIGGDVIHESKIDAIRYHGLLAEIPQNAIPLNINSQTFPLALIDQIMFLNPRAMTVYDGVEPLGYIGNSQSVNGGAPVAALLDGFPLENHNQLIGRIEVDDFLELERNCPAANRSHGTAMASLILHGDLNNPTEPPINSKLLVVPILQNNPHQPAIETTPTDLLTVDVIYRAIRRIKEGENGTEPSGPGVIIINHSLCDSNGEYNRRISPWGRLLDFLAFQYGLLIVVSAGNHAHRLPIQSFRTTSEFESATQEDKIVAYYQALAADMRNRQLLSPAEALNPITIGAWHADLCSADNLPANLIDITSGQGGPSIISAVGLGHKRSIKPDFYFDGGRIPCRIMPDSGCCTLFPVVQTTYTGQKVASPSNRGEINRTSNVCGTSNAAALITRQAIRLYETIDELEEEYGINIPSSYRAVLIKTLLAHGCSWSELGQYLDKIIEPLDGRKWQARRTNIARFLGLGRPDIERVLACTSQRGTIVGFSSIEVDQSHQYVVPLPLVLSGERDWRRMIVTLAWMSPVNPRHQQYRRAILDVELESKQFGTERKITVQTPKNTISRGTIVHSIFEGENDVVFTGEMSIIVTCRQQAGSLDDHVPYALAVSFEVGVDSQIDIYDEIKARMSIQPREPVAVS